jgi:hypothetical protein
MVSFQEGLDLFYELFDIVQIFTDDPVEFFVAYLMIKVGHLVPAVLAVMCLAMSNSASRQRLK